VDPAEAAEKVTTMKVKSVIAGGAACLALAVAAPAAADSAPGQALYPETVPGAGLSGVEGAQATIRHVVRGRGSAGVGDSLFRIDLSRPAGTVLYVDRTLHVAFRALSIGAVRFVDNTMTLHGIGIVNHRRVPFAALAVHNALPGVDVFRISWNHGPSRGGRVVDGGVFIR
jgi:hypothetical protein